MLEEFWPFWFGGIAIGLVAITLVLFMGKFLSVTRGYASLCSIITTKSYFNRPEMGGPMGTRSLFVLGIVIGGLLAALTTQGWSPNFQLGNFDRLWGPNLGVKAMVLISGGFLWGLGSRWARGCTSGNGISGLSRGSYMCS